MFRQELCDKVKKFFEDNPNSNRIAIQVSDKYIPVILEIVDWFASNYPLKFFFIVSDTSFNDCCIDFISADHLKAEAIIHFGPYCTDKYEIPVCFLPDFQLPNELNDQILSELACFVNNCSSKNLLIVLDQVNCSTEVFKHMCSDKAINLYFSATEKSGNLTRDSKLFDLYIPLDLTDFKDTSLIYIGPQEKLAIDLGCVFYNQASLCIDSKTNSLFSISIARELSKRSVLIDSISCFDHVGILIENPNLLLHVKTAQYLQKICAANDIIADIIYVGRLNEMKIGNFPDIEFFIHLSCSGRPLFSFFKPIVSPFEFLCAKFDLSFWDYQYLRDYEAFMAHCDMNKKDLLQDYEDQPIMNGQLIIKNFFELSTQIVSTRTNYSYNGLEIDTSFKEMRLHKGATGNSTSYDYESPE